MSPRLFLHRDSIVNPLFHSPRRLDGLSGSAGRLFPPSSTIMDDWLILASSELVTSVSRRGNSVFAFYGLTSRRVSNLLRLIEEFLSTPSPPASIWHRFLGHLSSLTFLVPDGMFRMRLLQPCLQDQWDFLDDQFQVSWFPLCREFSSLVDSSGPAAWRSILLFSSPRSQLLIRRFGCGLQALIGEHHA